MQFKLVQDSQWYPSDLLAATMWNPAYHKTRVSVRQWLTWLRYVGFLCVFPLWGIGKKLVSWGIILSTVFSFPGFGPLVLIIIITTLVLFMMESDNKGKHFNKREWLLCLGGQSSCPASGLGQPWGSCAYINLGVYTACHVTTGGWLWFKTHHFFYTS